MYRSRNDTYSSGFSDDSDDAALSETDASHSCSHRGLDERGTSPWLSPRAAPPASADTSESTQPSQSDQPGQSAASLGAPAPTTVMPAGQVDDHAPMPPRPPRPPPGVPRELPEGEYTDRGYTSYSDSDYEGKQLAYEERVLDFEEAAMAATEDAQEREDAELEAQRTAEAASLTLKAPGPSRAPAVAAPAGPTAPKGVNESGAAGESQSD